MCFLCTKNMFNKTSSLLTIIVLTLLAQFFFWPNFGTLDMSAFVHFAEGVAEFGIRGGYSYYNLYYPPLPTVFIAPFVTIGKYLEYETETKILILKIFLGFFYYLTAALIGIFAAKKGKTKEGILFAITLFLVNPAIFETTIILSYLDILMFPSLLLMCWFLGRKKYFLAGIFLSIAFMTKLLPVLLLPLFFAWFVDYASKKPRIKIHVKPALMGALGITLMSGIIIWYFGWNQIHTILQVSNDHGQALSYAYNAPRILREWKNDNTASPFVHDLGRVIFFATSTLLLIKFIQNKKTVERFAKTGVGIFLSYSLFFTGVHENHIFPALIMSFIAYLENKNKSNAQLLLWMTLISFSNLFIPYGFGYFENFGYTGLFLFWHFAIENARIWYFIISIIMLILSILGIKNILASANEEQKNPSEIS